VLELEPRHVEATEGLAGLYERQQLWPELLDVLREQAAAAPDDAARIALLSRGADVLEQQLDDVREAISLRRQALALDERHEPSIQALLRVGRAEDYREDALEALAPLLEAQGRWDDLAELLAL